MIRTILWKTLIEWWRDRRFKWLATGSLALLLATTLVGLQNTATLTKDQQAATAQELENFRTQGDKNPHAAAHFGQYAFRPTLLSAALDPGVMPWMGTMIWMEAHRRNLPEFRPAEDGAGYRAGTFLSVAWVLQYLIPLLTIVLGFSAIAAERERGTLSLMLAQGIALRTVVLGKAAALLLVLLAVLLPLGLVLLLGQHSTPTSMDADQPTARLIGIIASYFLYVVGFAGLVFLVTLLARTALSALSILLVVWMSLVILVPRLASDMAALQHPLPSATEFWDQIKRGEGLTPPASPIPAERAAALRAQVQVELLQQYGVSRIEDLPVNFTAVYLQRLEDMDVPIFDHAYGNLWQIQERQRTARTRWGGLSPTVPIREISMALAGTDPFAMRHFSEAAERHRRQLVRTLNEKQAKDGAGRAFYVAPADTWQSIPTLSYSPPTLREVLTRHRLDFFWLLMWAVLPCALAMRLTHTQRLFR